MSFARETKEELAHIIPQKSCCQRAELGAYLKMLGDLGISNKRLKLTIKTPLSFLARKILILLKNYSGLKTKTMVQDHGRLMQKNFYFIEIDERVEELLKEYGFLDDKGNLSNRINEQYIKNDCCRRSFLRGVFLAGGSLNDPLGDYHLELNLPDEAFARQVLNILQKYHFTFRLLKRKTMPFLYLKDAEQILSFLSLIGAHQSLLKFENVRVMKEVRNQVNRLVNCETANIEKAVKTAVKQIKDIKLISEKIGLESLDPALKEIAQLRLNNPDLSLKELGGLLNPPLTKSGVNHRFRKLEQLAEKIRNGALR
ncbi:DNA-binding protein WhiA [Carboxydothermus pertinax]|uniref:Probable cell division protein WhiA n=1 Tax=Carboxydothermus pertinax TaxID=870242 RepID=A0A1L8CRJ6_9THEO|nr:DNA-binding protein WhiA [Carboxydothermus pertinax]GAV21546.1 DNA-binding protein WhiA [Carboxydothermus pertinax]